MNLLLYIDLLMIYFIIYLIKDILKLFISKLFKLTIFIMKLIIFSNIK